MEDNASEGLARGENYRARSAVGFCPSHLGVSCRQSLFHNCCTFVCYQKPKGETFLPLTGHLRKETEPVSET
jgi:hypothetical protein